MIDMRQIASAMLGRSRVPISVIRSFGLGIDQARLMHHLIGNGLSKPYADERHLAEAMNWLCRAQDACQGQGVSAVYDLRKGWDVAYPETSGYIMATYLAYAEMMGDRTYIDRAIRIGDWETSIQTAGGGILSHPDRAITRVFNTGQVILGWCALYEATKNAAHLDAARKAGHYLVRIQERDGSWVQDTYCGARTYHARVDWSLLRLSALSGDSRFAQAAARNIAWVLRQQRPNGWFANCGFNNDDPIMHVIVYTLRGLLECHLTNDSAIREMDLLSAVIRSADALCDAVEQDPVRGIPWLVPTSYDPEWKSADRHSCLTGNAQFACFLYRLARHRNNERYRHTADKVLNATLATVLIDTPFPQINGALAGSYPFYLGYHRLSYPNWATKFLADALMMKIGFDMNLAIKA